MKWSKQIPQEDGYYWWRAGLNDNEPEIKKVSEGWVYEVAGEPYGEKVERFNYSEWAGPILPPEEQ